LACHAGEPTPRRGYARAELVNPRADLPNALEGRADRSERRGLVTTLAVRARWSVGSCALGEPMTEADDEAPSRTVISVFAHPRKDPPIWSSLKLGFFVGLPAPKDRYVPCGLVPITRAASALCPTFLWFGRHPVALDIRRSTLRRGAGRAPRTRLLPCGGTSRWPAPSSPPLVPGRPSGTGFPRG